MRFFGERFALLHFLKSESILEPSSERYAGLAKGINTYDGRLTNRPVDEALEIKYEEFNW